MIETPAFIVRSYPPFRMARIFRVYVDRDAVYLICMRGGEAPIVRHCTGIKLHSRGTETQSAPQVLGPDARAMPRR
jgi:hypothetical protein